MLWFISTLERAWAYLVFLFSSFPRWCGYCCCTVGYLVAQQLSLCYLCLWIIASAVQYIETQDKASARRSGLAFVILERCHWRCYTQTDVGEIRDWDNFNSGESSDFYFESSSIQPFLFHLSLTSFFPYQLHRKWVSCPTFGVRCGTWTGGEPLHVLYREEFNSVQVYLYSANSQ